MLDMAQCPLVRLPFTHSQNPVLIVLLFQELEIRQTEYGLLSRVVMAYRPSIYPNQVPGATRVSSPRWSVCGGDV